MKTLSETDVKVLYLLNRHPEGLSLTGLQKGVSIERKEYARYYLKKLTKKGWVQERAKLYYLIGDIKNISPVGPAKHITKTYHQQAKPRSQRPHAIIASSPLFRTSADNLKGTLEALGIPYKPETSNSISFIWRTYQFKGSTKNLFIYPKLPETLFSVPLEALKARAVQEAGGVLEAFLSETGLRCVRNSMSQLCIELRYWENGYPDNEIANESLKEGASTRVVYAYDRLTNKESVWGDGSLKAKEGLFELETNSGKFDKEIKAFIQAMDNGEIKPYEDEIKARQHITELYKLTQSNAQQIGQLAEQSAKLATNINIHEPFWESMNVVARHLNSPDPAKRARAAREIAKVAKGLEEAERQKRLVL